MTKRFLLLVVLGLVTGCSNEGDPIHFVVPEGFEGVIQLVLDGQDDHGYAYEDDRHVYTIPEDGVVHVRTLEPFEKWHTLSAIDTAGNLIYWYEPPPPDDQAKLIRSFGSTLYASNGGHRVSWFAVGSPAFIDRVTQWSYDRSEAVPVSEAWPRKD